jgi:hypothetical protein
VSIIPLLLVIFLNLWFSKSAINISPLAELTHRPPGFISAKVARPPSPEDPTLKPPARISCHNGTLLTTANEFGAKEGVDVVEITVFRIEYSSTT